MHVLELRRRQPPPLRLEIQHLPADHATCSGRAEQLEGDRAAPGPLQVECGHSGVEHAGAERYHVKAGHGGGPDVECAVGGRPAAPQVVVVHAGKVVVDQGVRVHDLDRRRELRHPGRSPAPTGFRRGEHQRGAQALAGREQAVADRRRERRTPPAVGAGAPGFEGRIHAGAGVQEVDLEGAVSRRSPRP